MNNKWIELMERVRLRTEEDKKNRTEAALNRIIEDLHDLDRMDQIAEEANRIIAGKA